LVRNVDRRSRRIRPALAPDPIVDRRKAGVGSARGVSFCGIDALLQISEGYTARIDGICDLKPTPVLST
jgi:hypothetical protein